MGKLRYLALGATALALLGATPAFALVNLVQNGDFENVSGGNGINGQVNFNGFSVDNWTVPGTASTSYTFIFNSVASATAGVPGFFGTVALKTANNGFSLAPPPDGGNFIAADPLFKPSPLEQTINTVAGKDYTVSFEWAVAQQAFHDGATGAGWSVSLNGSPFQSTGNVGIPNGGFSGWMHGDLPFHRDRRPRSARVLGDWRREPPHCRRSRCSTAFRWRLCRNRRPGR